MTRILMVRHGQSEWNAEGRWQGQADPPLSRAGREEARLAAEALAGFSGLVFSSPLMRAKQTAEILSDAIVDGVVKIEPDLREIDVGDFSGLTNRQIEEKMPDAWATLRAGELHTYPNGEAREHLRERVLAALSAISIRHPAEQILLVTHGGVIASVERHLGAHPGVGVRNLEARWFEVSGDSVEVAGDRIGLIPAGHES